MVMVMPVVVGTVVMQTVVAAVTVQPATCYVRMLKPFFKVKRRLSLCTIRFISYNTEAHEEEEEKTEYTVFLNAVLHLLFYSTAFNFIMSSSCQVACKRCAVIN